MRNTKSLKAIQKQRSKLINKLREQDPKLATALETVKLDWYRIKNADADSDLDEADVFIYDEIMPAFMAEWFGGVSAEGLIAELSEITAGTINVRINSPGGSIFEAIAIHTALNSHSANINVYIDSIAASAASVIAMAGDKVVMHVGSQMMIHDAMTMEFGNPRELRETADWLDDQSNNLASIYANRTGGEAEEWRTRMQAETWFYGQEAVDFGLADELFVKPAKGKKMPQEMPPDEEEEEEDESEEDDEEMMDEEEAIDSLMSNRHSLVNRGFKYPGRKKAPDPSPVDEIDELVNFYASLGGK